ncbi:hypothetical protein B0H13DRAFT_1898637 [Mycena leptocephala]|nr:hypothetical protein B0H13DRAFT_1898637 [Mycena leptocephala]
MNVLRSGANTNAARGPPATPPNLLHNPHLVDENTPPTPPNSLQNPYLVDEMGRFVRILASPNRPQLKRSPSGKYSSYISIPSHPDLETGRALLIYGGQPSERFSRAARDAANAPPYQRPLAPPAAVQRSAGNRNRRPQRPPMVSSALTRVRWLRGFRTQRETPLTEADLYATEAQMYARRTKLRNMLGKSIVNSPPGSKFYPDRETSLASFYSDPYFGTPSCPPADLRLMPRLKPATAKSHCSDTPPIILTLIIVYYSNRDSLRLAAQAQMKLHRSRKSDATTSAGGVSESRLRARASAAKYRET